ncbi:MAG: GrpE [Leptospirillum sp. Group IV 'UBA BS']|nr:MAG: GrpE [Leptospirillum sp. Group IV 'UBA BS']
MALLKNEVRTGTRQSKGLLQELRQYSELLKEENDRLSRDLERAKEKLPEVRRQAEREILLGVLDLRDRLESGVEALSSRKTSFFSRFFSREARLLDSLAEGLSLTLGRSDDFLARFRVRSFSSVGKALDPEIMRAVTAESAEDLPEGVVVREIRKGFFIDGDLLRVAEVVVNKKGKG